MVDAKVAQLVVAMASLSVGMTADGTVVRSVVVKEFEKVVMLVVAMVFVRAA